MKPVGQAIVFCRLPCTVWLAGYGKRGPAYEYSIQMHAIWPTCFMTRT